jgi:membrane protease YdiL (CAAX protease family)
MSEYVRAARHPLTSLLFVLPLLVAYEVGVVALAGAGGDGVRNGADAWVRSQLAASGVSFAWTAPILLVAYLVVRCAWEWGGRPKQPFATCFGMFIESVVFAAVIWILSRNFYPLLEQSGVPLNQIPAFKPVAAGQVIQFIGAGIYEEVLFRVALFGVLYVLVRLTLMPKLFAILLAAAGASLLFAAAHHWGANGEPINTAKFLFRTAAGLVFTALYVTRGLGIAVGAHAGYNILVGVSVA